MFKHPAASLPRRSPRLRSILLWALCLGAGALSAGESRIELRDGSVIGGELLSVADGLYRIRSATLGEVQVRESDVLAIRPATAPSATPVGSGANGGGNAPAGDLAAIQQQVLGNPRVMESITRLQSDPAIAATLADPEFVRLVLSGDLQTLRTDPRFQRLMENPAIQAIVGQVLGR